MPNTTPALDEPGVLSQIRAAAAASGSPVELLAHGAVSTGRAGETLAALGELADAGVVGFSDDGAPVRSAPILRNALAYAGALGLPIVDHPEDATLTDGAEANDGFVATVLGLRGWPAAAEEAAVGRDLAILADVVRDVPGARLHLTHVSTAGALDLVRRAKAAGLPVTCDVTPHHLALTDEWIAGARRFAWEAGEDGDPWRDGVALVRAPYASSLRVNPPLRTPADALACLAALADGTADAIATDHAPHTEVDKAVEFGMAANGISGIETALGLVLEAVDAGQLTLVAGDRGADHRSGRVLGGRSRRNGSVGLVEGAPADLVVFDRSERWTVTRGCPVVQGQELAAARDGPARPRPADDGRRSGGLRGTHLTDQRSTSSISSVPTSVGQPTPWRIDATKCVRAASPNVSKPVHIFIRSIRSRAQTRRRRQDMDVSDTRPRSGAEPSRRSGCLAPGCPCQDARIVSHRRARFFTHLAVANGETARPGHRARPGLAAPTADTSGLRLAREPRSRSRSAARETGNRGRRRSATLRVHGFTRLTERRLRAPPVLAGVDAAACRIAPGASCRTRPTSS